jgi:tetratricopeptide (TPR) repeat protein
MRRIRLIALAALVVAAPGSAASQPRLFLASYADTAAAAVLVRADRAFAAQRWREAADLYQGGLAMESRAPQRWRALGDALFNTRRHREAIAAYERALQLGASEPAVGAWQIARAYALEGNGKQAVRWLEQAMQLGFSDRDAIRQEPAFDPYRDDARFSALLEAREARRSRGAHAACSCGEREGALGRQGSNLQLPG